MNGLRARARRFQQRVFGHPFVYEKIRPLVIGGLDMTPAYCALAAGPDDVVLDVGCGTGDALNYITHFRSYHGFDNDGEAVAFARRRWSGRPDVHYEARTVAEADLTRLRPTKVMLAGLLHHLSDADALGLLGMCLQAPSVQRIATQDVVFLPGERVSNLLARLDRGRFVRDVPGFLSLARRAGLRVVGEEIVRSHPENGRAKYLIMTLEPPAAPSRTRPLAADGLPLAKGERSA